MPQISILMPAFNGAPFIAQAIESIISQSFPDWELIICDDGSTDDTAEIVRFFCVNSCGRVVYE